jgi:uncharacterized membrane protein YbhN (UPF0104 family)
MPSEASSIPMRCKPLLKLILRVLITGVLMVWVLREVGLQDLLATLKTARWEFLLGVWAGTLASFWINAWKLKRILHGLSCPVRTRTVFAVSAMGCTYSLVLPGLVSSGMKWLLLRQDTQDGSRVLSGMVYNQLSMIATALGIGLLALVAWDPGAVLGLTFAQPGRVRGIALGLLGGLFLATYLALAPWSGGRLLSTANRVQRRLLPRRLAAKAEGFINHVRIFQSLPAGFHVQMILMTVLNMLVGGVLVYLCAASAANVQVTWGVLAYLSMVVYILGRVPITIGNLGVREVTLAGLLALHGVDKPTALLMSMAIFSGLVFMAVLGLLYLLLWSPRESASR